MSAMFPALFECESSECSLFFFFSGPDIHTNVLCRIILCRLASVCGHLSGE